MQTAILLGRKIRDNVKISLKTPLQKFIVVENDPSIIQYLKTTEKYIKDELNCLELEFQTNEADFVTYKSEPDNTLCGKAFGKIYKDLKAKL